MTPKVVPLGGRIIAELAQEHVDVALLGVDDYQMPFYQPTVSFHPIAIASLSTNYYTLRDNKLKTDALEKLSDYRLGIVRSPRSWNEAVLNQKLGPITFFNNALYLSKGLASQRIDIMISSALTASRIFRKLDIQDAISCLGQSYTISLHIAVRNSLPAQQKRAIFTFLDQRIPTLKYQNRFRKILMRHSLGTSSPEKNSLDKTENPKWVAASGSCPASCQSQPCIL